MSIRTFFRTYFEETSYEYVIHKIKNLPLRGDKSLVDKAELCRLKRELLCYFSQKLEEIKKRKDVLDLKFGGIYYKESSSVLEQLRNLDIEAIVMLQQSLKTKEAIDPMPRNQFSEDIDLAKLYEGTLYYNNFVNCLKLIENHIKTL